MNASAPIVLLMADDDEDDLLLTRDAFRESKFANDVGTVRDGVELLDYLLHRGEYTDPATAPRPGLILLDLNMPRMDGCEALRRIKADADLRRIPVAVLTTSRAEEDILRTYDLGAAGFVTKPVSFDGLVGVVRTLGDYWFQLVQLPNGNGSG
jgi:CheY-like chemotaxis protein